MSQQLNGESEPTEPNEESPQTCHQCQTIPDQYISLKCGHNLCLPCLTQIYQDLRNSSQELDYQIICPFDQIETILDEYSLSALQKTLESAQNQEYNGEIHEELQNSSNNENPLLKSNEKSQENNKEFQKEEDQDIMEFRIKEPSKQPEFEERIKEIKEPANNLEYFQKCSKHKKEIANIYCFTCESGFFCVQCLANGFHNNHDLKNLAKNPEEVNKKIDVFVQKLKNTKEILSENLGELGSKRKIISNKVNETRTQIINDFKELREKLISKEKDLLQKNEEYSNEKLQEIDEEIFNLKEKFNHINYIEEMNKTAVYSSDSASLEKTMKFYESLKTDLERLQKLDIHKKTIEDFSEFKCYLNMDTFYKYLENIQILKLEIAGISAKKKIQSPYKIQKIAPKSYLINNNNNSLLEYHDNGFMDFENYEIKRKTMYEKNLKIPENSFLEKKQYLFFKSGYDFNPFHIKRSLAAINKSTSSFMNEHLKDSNRTSGIFIKKMKEIGLNKIDERQNYNLRGNNKKDRERLMTSLEKQRSLFEKNKNCF